MRGGGATQSDDFPKMKGKMTLNDKEIRDLKLKHFNQWSLYRRARSNLWCNETELIPSQCMSQQGEVIDPIDFFKLRCVSGKSYSFASKSVVNGSEEAQRG